MIATGQTACKCRLCGFPLSGDGMSGIGQPGYVPRVCGAHTADEIRRAETSMTPAPIKASSIYPGHLLQCNVNATIGRASVKQGDILRCTGSTLSQEPNRVFINRRTRTNYCLPLSALPGNFQSIGFDGLEDIEA